MRSLLIIVDSTHGALGVPGGLRDHGGHVLPNDLGGHAGDRCGLLFMVIKA